jgi:hypothetical protein
MIPINPFDPYDGAVMDAHERRRRAALGALGRLREDAALAGAITGFVALLIAATIVPWAIGAWTIAQWAMGGGK